MRENPMDRVINGARIRSDRIRNKIKERYGKTRPFDTPIASTEQKLYDYEQLKPQDIMGMIRNYGADTTDEFIFEMEQLKQRRMKNA